jgi:AraC-like DNA-binding protein
MTPASIGAGPVAVREREPGLWVRRGTSSAMSTPHRHDDLELNLVLSGELDYLFGGVPLTIRAGEVALFWGATPHQLTPTPEPAEVSWVHIPVSEVLGWGVPAATLATLLQAEPIVIPVDAVARDCAALFECWHRDVSAERDLDVVMLEVQAFLRRAVTWHTREAATSQDGVAGPQVGASDTGASRWRATEMAQYAAAHFRSPIGPSDIAVAANLSPTYAMTTFKALMGMTLGAYLMRCRVAEAQRLLITSDLPVLDIGRACGYTSSSTFYAQFARICGVAPGSYRRQTR